MFGARANEPVCLAACLLIDRSSSRVSAHARWACEPLPATSAR